MRLSTMVARAVTAAAFTGGLLLLGSAPAQAATTIPINPGSLPTTAAGFGTPECTQTGSFPDRDGWVFVLPGNRGTFVSVTLTFATAGGTVVLTIPTDGGAISTDGGASKAWITTPLGYTLVDGSAVIEGRSNGFFVLTHTCPATGTPSPSSPPATPSPTPPSSPPTSESSSAAAVIADVAASPGAAFGILLTGSLFSTGAIVALRRRRDRVE